jgi:MFS family permease
VSTAPPAAVSTLATPSSSGSFRSLRVRNYRLFAGGQLVSLTGTWMQMTAQDWLVLELGGGGVGLGGVLALQFLPTLLFGLYGGVVADRVDKRRLLLVTQTCSGVLAAGLAVLVLTGAVTLPLVFVFAGLLGTANAFDTPARQAFVAEMVGSDLLPNAVALNSVTFNAARIVGPAVAGVLIGAVGTWPVFAVNSVSYVAVVSGLLAMRERELHPAKRSAREPGQFRAGVATIVGRRELLLPIVLVGIVGTFGLNFPVTLALMANQTFAGTAATYGAFTSSVAVGSLLGAVLATRRRRITFRLLVTAAVAFGAAEAVAGLMPTRLAFMALLVPTGAAVLTFTTAANATVQLAAGEQMRGRVMSFYILVFLGTTPLGAPLIGLLSQHFGARSGLVVGGLLCAGAALVVGLLLRRELVDGTEPGQVSSQPPTSKEAEATSSTRAAASRSPSPAASRARRSGSSIVATATASADGPAPASGDDEATTPRAS